MSQAPRQPVKKAVLVGCAYPGDCRRERVSSRGGAPRLPPRCVVSAGSRHALNGCLNDVACMAHCLKTRYGFPEKVCCCLGGLHGRAGCTRCMFQCAPGDEQQHHVMIPPPQQTAARPTNHHHAQNIVVLKDDTAQPDFTSTRQNIMRAIQWWVACPATRRSCRAAAPAHTPAVLGQPPLPRPLFGSPRHSRRHTRPSPAAPAG
jgi:hypothetical protein